MRRLTGDGDVRELRRTLERVDRGGGAKGDCAGAGVDPKELLRRATGVAVGVVEADEFAVLGRAAVNPLLPESRRLSPKRRGDSA